MKPSTLVPIKTDAFILESSLWGRLEFGGRVCKLCREDVIPNGAEGPVRDLTMRVKPYGRWRVPSRVLAAVVVLVYCSYCGNGRKVRPPPSARSG